MGYKTGKAKSLDDIKIDDVLKYPIWVWALDEETVEGQDETWQKPVIDTTNVTAEMFYPIITVRVKNTDIYGSGEYDRKEKELSGVTIWQAGDWIDLHEFVAMPVPVTFVAVPTLEGQSDVEFVYADTESDRAVRK